MKRWGLMLLVALVPNIVATVKDKANFEPKTLNEVIEARAKATSIQVTPEAFNKLQAAQGKLGTAFKPGDDGVGLSSPFIKSLPWCSNMLH